MSKERIHLSNADTLIACALAVRDMEDACEVLHEMAESKQDMRVDDLMRCGFAIGAGTFAGTLAEVVLSGGMSLTERYMEQKGKFVTECLLAETLADAKEDA